MDAPETPELDTSDGETNPMRLAAGMDAPDFVLQDSEGQTVSLPQFRGRRVLLYFYPAAMTPGCTTQANDFQDNLAELDGLGVAVIGVSPDSVEKLAQFREKENLSFPLLSDPEKSVLQAYGAYGEKSMYGKKTVGVIRSTFLIGASGVIEKAMYNVKATGHVAKVIRELPPE